MGIPGPLDVSEDGHVTNVANPKAFPGWHRVPVVEILERRLELPVFLENNATAAAIGERWYGAGQHIATFFYVFFSEGLGGGIIFNGQPYDGHTGNAGELGYCYLPPDVLTPEDLTVFKKTPPGHSLQRAAPVPPPRGGRPHGPEPGRSGTTLPGEKPNPARLAAHRPGTPGPDHPGRRVHPRSRGHLFRRPASGADHDLYY
ncbi:ROK family protein [Rhodothermus marinus]|uniref:ROK family protein n=1 Tax=Rhodothermus marinus TaxID=29549 RepID=UPI001FB36C9B|nr:ROK family protein [Rhodothermus marinus]